MHVLFKTGPGLRCDKELKLMKVWIYDDGVAQRRSATARFCEIDNTVQSMVQCSYR